MLWRIALRAVPRRGSDVLGGGDGGGASTHSLVLVAGCQQSAGGQVGVLGPPHVSLAVLLPYAMGRM